MLFFSLVLAPEPVQMSRFFHVAVCDFNFRWAVSLSGFANLSTKITTKQEFRLSLSFLLSKNT